MVDHFKLNHKYIFERNLNFLSNKFEEQKPARSMPRSFLIKKVEKVVTGFFPWNPDTLVEGCCLQYQTADEVDCNTDVEFFGSEKGKNLLIINACFFLRLVFIVFLRNSLFAILIGC